MIANGLPSFFLRGGLSPLGVIASSLVGLPLFLFSFSSRRLRSFCTCCLSFWATWDFSFSLASSSLNFYLFCLAWDSLWIAACCFWISASVSWGLTYFFNSSSSSFSLSTTLRGWHISLRRSRSSGFECKAKMAFWASSWASLFSSFLRSRDRCL